MILLESNQNHATAKDTEICTTLSASMGMGGGYVPMITDALPFDTPQVTSPMNYSVPHWGDACHPLAANQHPPAVAVRGDGSNLRKQEEMQASTFAFQAIGEYKRSDAASALKMRDYKDATDLAVRYGLDRASYNQGENAQYDFSVEEDKIGAQVAKGPGAVVTSVVRRLTPAECEALQGFPNGIVVDFEKMTKDEYIAWNLAEGNIIADADTGKVYSTRGPGGIRYQEPHELKGTMLNGYRVVSIRNGKTKLQCRVHRVIWISQNGILPDGYVVDHINNDKQDNRITNLQLLTPEQNVRKAYEDGMFKSGLESPRTILDPELHGKIAYLHNIHGISIRKLADLYGVSKSRIHQIVHEEAWTLIGKPEEVEVKDYKTEWIPSSDCKYETVDEARQEHLEAFLDDELDEEDYDAFDPKKYGFVEKRTQIGSHTEIQYFYTDRDGKKKRCADSARYKAIGNSIAVGYANQQSRFWMWLMKRISAQYERSATLGSLFDGIGGFPLAWEFYNGRGSAVWASEVEPFCIEVTRRRFPDPDDIPED